MTQKIPAAPIGWIGTLCTSRCVVGWRPWRCAETSVRTQSPVLRPTVIAFRCTSANIGHHFHDDFWSLYSWARLQQRSGRNFTIAYSPAGCAEWSKELFKLATEEYGWHVEVMATEKPVCASDVLLLAGKDRHLTFERASIRLAKEELRVAALRTLRPALPPAEARARVVILTRLRLGESCGASQPTLRVGSDVTTRRLCDVRPLTALFDVERTQVDVVGSLPGAFHAQVNIFADTQLLVAPSGGWNPNTLWLPSDSCVVEAHQYALDSWLAFGLHLGLGALCRTAHPHDVLCHRLSRRSRSRGR